VQRLDPRDIDAIARRVVSLMRQGEETRLDVEYLATLPVEEMKARCRAEMRGAK